MYINLKKISVKSRVRLTKGPSTRDDIVVQDLLCAICASCGREIRLHDFRESCARLRKKSPHALF